MELLDPQQERLYEWERAFVETKVSPEMMSIEEIRLLVARVSALLGYPPPRLKLLKGESSCRANLRDHILEIAEWGRARVTILHELAHFGAWRAMLYGDSPHGRAFTSLAIALYARYLGLPIDYLVDSAQSRRLDFDEHFARGKIGAELNSDFYPGDL